MKTLAFYASLLISWFAGLLASWLAGWLLHDSVKGAPCCPSHHVDSDRNTKMFFCKSVRDCIQKNHSQIENASRLDSKTNSSYRTCDKLKIHRANTQGVSDPLRGDLWIKSELFCSPFFDTWRSQGPSPPEDAVLSSA